MNEVTPPRTPLQNYQQEYNYAINPATFSPIPMYTQQQPSSSFACIPVPIQSHQMHYQSFNDSVQYQPITVNVLNDSITYRKPDSSLYIKPIK